MLKTHNDKRSWLAAPALCDDVSLHHHPGAVLSLHGPDGPPIDMKIGLSLCGMLKGRGRHRSDFTLDKVRPFLSLIGNARFEPIYVAPSLRVGW